MDPLDQVKNIRPCLACNSQLYLPKEDHEALYRIINLFRRSPGSANMQQHYDVISYCETWYIKQKTKTSNLPLMSRDDWKNHFTEHIRQEFPSSL